MNTLTTHAALSGHWLPTEISSNVKGDLIFLPRDAPSQLLRACSICKQSGPLNLEKRDTFVINALNAACRGKKPKISDVPTTAVAWGHLSIPRYVELIKREREILRRIFKLLPQAILEDKHRVYDEVCIIFWRAENPGP